MGRTMQRKRGGRLPKEFEDDHYVSPEEMRKRKLRREKNRLAATRCRQKRLDQIAALSKLVEELQDRENQLRSQIDQLAKEKSELEFVLQLHQKTCSHMGTLQSGIETVEERPASIDFISKDALDFHSGLTPDDSMYQFNAGHNMFTTIGFDDRGIY